MIDLKLYGLILNGGRNSRMGFDKGELDFHGKPQRSFLAELLKKFCGEVFVSVKGDHTISGLPALPDRFKLESPLNGILTAFDYRHDIAWLTVPVDMPGINEDVLSFLISNRNAKAVATCFTDEDGIKPEPLVAVWEAHAYPLLRTFFESGNVSPREFLIKHNCHLLHSPNRSFHRNINTADEMKDYKSEKS